MQEGVRMSTSASTKKSAGSSAFAVLQRIGKSLMLPIAVLPAAGILLRLGQPDLLGGIGESGPEVGDGPFSILSYAGGAIAGSTLTLDHAVRFAVQQVGLDLPQAIAAASATPARMLGLADRGTLTPGTRADLVHLDDGLALTHVWRAGAAVPR